MSRFGAIDIGTNAARLLIGEVEEEDDVHFVKKISYTRIPLRLGTEVFETGSISIEKEEEFTKSIHAFKLLSEVFKVDMLRACATSAMREAINGKDVRKRIKKQTGVDIEIIDGIEEAELILSTFFLIDYNEPAPFVVIDVGGGSTEISVFKKGERVAARSFPLGTLRILAGKVDKSVWGQLNKWIDKSIKKNTEYKVFATGGNINNIHKILGKKSTETINLLEFEELYDRMSTLSVKKRISEFKIKPDRADVIVPAFEIYLHVFKKMKTDTVYVPKVGLSDGMIYNLHQNYKP